MKDKFYTPEEIGKKFDSLPPDIQALINSAEMLSAVQSVATKYKLHIDQTGILEAEVADVMAGFSPIDKFVSNLVSALSIDQTTAEGVAKDINEGLFLKIRESMKKTYEAQKEGAPVATSKPAAASAPTVPAVPALVVPKPTQVHPADMMLAAPSVSTAPPVPKTAPPIPTTPPAPAASQAPKADTPPQEPPKPKPYSTDPYREPTN